MGMIGDHKIVLDKRLSSSRYEWQLIGGDGSSFSIHFYTKSTDDGKILTSLTEGSDFKDTKVLHFQIKFILGQVQELL